MSFFENQIVGIAGTLIGKMLTISPSRSFAGFSEFCSITEVHNAAVQATQYPIEDGTQGTDHIVRLPDVLQWEVVFEERSNPRQTYDRLRKLMISGEPFKAETGLKSYTNLILLSISASQDVHTGRILRCTLSLQEIIITSAVATALPPRARQALANQTGSTAKTGSKSLGEASPKQKSDLDHIAEDVRGFFR